MHNFIQSVIQIVNKLALTVKQKMKNKKNTVIKQLMLFSQLLATAALRLLKQFHSSADGGWFW